MCCLWHVEAVPIACLGGVPKKCLNGLVCLLACRPWDRMDTQKPPVMPHTCNYFDDPDRAGDGGQSGPPGPGRAAACCTSGASGENAPAAAGSDRVERGGAATVSPDHVPPEPLLYTPEQAAERLGVKPSWLRRKAAARAVPCTFVGKHLRFSRADVEAIITAGQQLPTGHRRRR
jgi:excisionase family DNA binding protein